MDQDGSAIDKKLKRRFWIFLFVAILFMSWMRFYLPGFNSREIVQYEMAKAPEKATAIISQWSQTPGKQVTMIKSIYVDYFFIVVYCLAISAGCRYISSLTKNEILVKAGIFFSYFIFVAGIFDVVENIAMTKSLRQEVTYANVSLAYKMAISKFSIILMSLFFVAVSLMFWLIGLLSGKEKSWK